jgi:hypothetical protein
MSTNKIKAGEAFILIRAIDKTAPVLQKVSQRFDQVGANIRNFGLVIGGIGAAITGVFIKPLKVASEVTEQQNKFFQVFGTHVGKEVEARLKGIAQETGRSHLKMYKFASAFGGLLKGQGATTRQAADMSKALVSMGVDFSSFNDIMDDTREGSMRRFVSALSGSAEVLDQYGVAAKESALGPALQQMFGVGVRGATELQKSTARAFSDLQVHEAAAGTGRRAPYDASVGQRRPQHQGPVLRSELRHWQSGAAGGRKTGAVLFEAGHVDQGVGRQP